MKKKATIKFPDDMSGNMFTLSAFDPLDRTMTIEYESFEEQKPMELWGEVPEITQWGEHQFLYEYNGCLRHDDISISGRYCPTYNSAVVAWNEIATLLKQIKVD